MCIHAGMSWREAWRLNVRQKRAQLVQLQIKHGQRPASKQDTDDFIAALKRKGG